MPTTRLAAQVESIDPDSLSISAEDAAELMTRCQGMLAARLAGKTDRETIEDAAQVASLLACSLLAEMGGDHAATAALATYRVSLSALEDQGTTKEDAADVLATDPTTGEPLLRLALPGTRRPDALTLTTDRDRLADSFASLADEDPAAAQVAAWLTYLPEADGNGWRSGIPTAALLASYGWRNPRTKTVTTASKGTTKKATTEDAAAALAALAEHGTATLHRHATRTRYGASPQIWTDHAAQVEDCQPADPTARQYGRPRVTPRSGTASPVIHHHTDTGDEYLQVTTGSTPTLLALPADLDRAWILAQTATLPPYGRTAQDTSGDNYAAALEPLGAVKKANTAKRKRDGSIGSPMVTGSTRQRY